MPSTTISMNAFACQYMDALVERKLNEITKNSLDTADFPYTGIHSGLGPPDRSLIDAVHHLSTVPPSTFHDHEPEGWYEDNFAWWMLFPKSVQPDGTVFQLRVTLIARRETNEWKVIHWHVSEAVDRAAAFGETPRV